MGALATLDIVSPALDQQICSYLFRLGLAKCTVHVYANYISRLPVHTYIKVTVTGTGLEDFRDPIFVSRFISGIQKTFDTFALPANHYTLPPVAGDDGDDGKILEK